MLEIAIVLIVGFGLGYGVREWGPAAAARPSILAVCADGAKQRDGDVPFGDRRHPGRHLAVDLYSSGVIGGRRQYHKSSHSGAFRDNARRPECRALFFQRFLSPALQRGPFPELGS